MFIGGAHTGDTITSRADKRSLGIFGFSRIICPPNNILAIIAKTVRNGAAVAFVPNYDPAINLSSGL